MWHQVFVFTMVILGSTYLMMMGCSAGDDKPMSSKDKPVRQITEAKTTNPDADVKPIAPETDTGLAKDLRRLRKTVPCPGKPLERVSSGDAIEAARRVFGRLKLIGMSKGHVLWMLGDPKTISDRALSPEPGKDSPLIYRFAIGTKVYDWVVRLKDGRVTSVKYIPNAY